MSRPADRFERNLASASSPSSGCERRGLPGEVQRHRQQGEQGEPFAPDQMERHRPEAERGEIAERDAEPGVPAQGERGGAHADQGVVLLVLQRVDRVVADHPEDRPRPEQPGRRAELARHRRPADQSAPGEDQAEPGLRPPGDPLHERIGRDRRQAGERDDLRGRAAAGAARRARSGSSRPAGPRRRFSDTRLLASGLRRVRSTLASRSRSTMSL